VAAGRGHEQKRRGQKNDRMMAGNKERGQRLETLAAEWTRIARRGGETPARPGTTLARMVSARLQTLYPAPDLGDESEALQRLMAELAAKDP
jgi:hypothetical protein